MMDLKIVKLSVLALVLTLINLPVTGIQNPVFEDSFEDGNFTDSWTVIRNHSTGFGKPIDRFAKSGDMSMRVHIGELYSGDFDFQKNISEFKGFRKNLSFWIRPNSDTVKAAYGFLGPRSYMKVNFDARGRLKFKYINGSGHMRKEWFGNYEPKVWYKVSLSVNPEEDTSTFKISGQNGREEEVGPVTTNSPFTLLRFGVGDIGGPTDLYLDDVVLESSGRREDSNERVPEPAPNNSVLVVEPEWEKVLKASTVPQPVLVTSDYGKKFHELVNSTDPEEIYALGNLEGSPGYNITSLAPEHVLPVFFPNSTEAVSVDAEYREHTLKAAQYAREKAIPLAFEGDSGVNRIELSERELEKRYIESVSKESEINHVVLADTKAPSSALAPRYASKQNAYLAVEGGSDKTPEDFIDTLKTSIDELREQGQGTESLGYMTDGMYLTLFGTPHKKLEDPVSEINLSSDGSSREKVFHSDMIYTDLNGDGRADLNYGRIPRSVEKASKMFKTDLESDNALVAGEYGRSAWPGVLMYRGGGMWSAKKMRSVFQNQGFETKFLAEKRVSPTDTRKTLTNIPFHLFGVPSPEEALDAVDDIKNNLIEGDFESSVRTLVNNAPGLAKAAAVNSDKVAKYTGNLVSAGAVKNVFGKTSLALFRALALKDSTRLLQTYMENDIDPKRETLKKVLSKEAIKDPAGVFVDSVQTSLEPYPELNTSSLRREASSADKVYFVGVSNSSHWILPNRKGDRLEISGEDGAFNQYNGSKSYVPSNISGFVYDGSDEALAPEGTYRTVLSKGAEGVLGFTSDTYLTHSEDIGRGFFQKGLTKGRAWKKAVNNFVKSGWSFDAEAMAKGSAGASLESNPGEHAERIYRTVRKAYERHNRKRAKTFKSSVMYGEPEEKKDPEVKDYKSPEKNCGDGHCNYTWSLETNYRNVDGILMMDKDLESIEVPRLPNLFFHKVERTFSEDTDLNVSAKLKETSFVASENPIEGVLPQKLLEKNIYTLPDGRKKLVLKHMALQYTDSGVKVFDKLELRARAEQDMHINISTEQSPNSTANGVIASVYSGINTTGRIAFTVANQTWKTTRTTLVNFTAGSNIFSREFDLQSGRYRASVVVDSEERLGPVSADFRVRELADPRIDLEVKEAVEEGDRFDAVVTASNRGGLPKEVEARLKGSKAVQPDFFENKRFSFNLSGGEKIRRKVKMRAFKPGNHSIELISNAGNDSAGFKAEPASFASRMISSLKHLISQKKWFEDFSAETRKDGLLLELDRPDAYLKVEKEPEKSTYYMYRKGISIRLEENPSRKKLVLESPRGKAKIIEGHNGRRTARKGEVSIQKAERLQKLMQREVQKLLNRYYLERGKDLPEASFLEVIDRWV